MVGPAVSTKGSLAGMSASAPDPGKPIAVRPVAAQPTKPTKPTKPDQPKQPKAPKPTGPVKIAANPATNLTGHVVGTTGPRMLDSLFVVFDTTTIKFDVKPTVKEGMAIAPFRQIFEHTGGSIEWINELKVVNAKSEKVAIELKIGRDTGVVNGEELLMQLAPYIQQGRTMVPLSFMRDALKLKMDYDPSTGRVYLSSQ